MIYRQLKEQPSIIWVKMSSKIVPHEYLDLVTISYSYTCVGCLKYKHMYIATAVVVVNHIIDYCVLQ